MKWSYGRMHLSSSRRSHAGRDATASSPRLRWLQRTWHLFVSRGGRTTRRRCSAPVECKERGWTHVRLIPLTEGSGVDLGDGTLDEGVRPDQLVVRGVVHLDTQQHPSSAKPTPQSTGKVPAGRRTTPMIRVLRVVDSEPQAKLPESRRSARYFRLPPRTRTVWTRLAPSLVRAG